MLVLLVITRCEMPLKKKTKKKQKKTKKADSLVSREKLPLAIKFFGNLLFLLFLVK